MAVLLTLSAPLMVAPVRERGLKYRGARKLASINRRSREGAWIEMLERHYWRTDTFVAPVRERGLKFIAERCLLIIITVAPVRERGLKCRKWSYRQKSGQSRSREGAWIEMARKLDADTQGTVAPVRERGLK